MKSIELLSPAGTLKSMRHAFAFGADAVYAGQPRYSLRVRNNEFTMENLRTGINEAHMQGKKFFVASNLLPHNAKLKTYMKDMEPIIEMAPDALIMADPGLIHMVRERWPEMTIHLSVQANTMNSAAVKFWKSIGIERVILSRELSLDEVAEIRQDCPDMELEVFVHGALCIAYSGRCLLSGYMNHRDPNQGTCTNACRWDYKVHQTETTDTGDVRLHRPDTQVMMLEEPKRPDEPMPIYEDEHGTYIMNSKDLRAVQHVWRLAEIGVDSLKIEGRTKSPYYVARTAQIYRRAIDDAVAGKPFDKNLMVELDGLANRGYTEGFYRRHVPEDYQNYQTGSSVSSEQLFVAEMLEYDEATGKAKFDIKNRLEVGDTVVMLTPGGNTQFVLHHMEDTWGKPVTEAPGSGYQICIHLPHPPGDLALLVKEL
ncbi:MAG: tRNA 5-hydroxyuridine modification protein YegQ [Gammaproteobacteria bacterium]|nr:tRNA 5-hydroxyuridine modification protein YegQ [Gammaproteobacteria bacterium]MDH5730380.1 tRNA 5-hydroxyuridine modification protein YegQ [Gammaproteobacteria bacterium]